jgi:hypothetical protein
MTVVAPYLELGKGTQLSGLSAEQISRRRLCLNEIGKGEYELTHPTHFKQGETFEMKEVPKNLREFVSTEGEHKAPVGKTLPVDLDSMNRAELVELAEGQNIKVAANATKHEIIADLKKAERKADKASRAA